jgi:hypothetical protein
VSELVGGGDRERSLYQSRCSFGLFSDLDNLLDDEMMVHYAICFSQSVVSRLHTHAPALASVVAGRGKCEY